VLTVGEWAGDHDSVGFSSMAGGMVVTRASSDVGSLRGFRTAGCSPKRASFIYCCLAVMLALAAIPGLPNFLSYYLADWLAFWDMAHSESCKLRQTAGVLAQQKRKTRSRRNLWKSCSSWTN